MATDADRRIAWQVRSLGLGLAILSGIGLIRVSTTTAQTPPIGARFYSTAAPPRDFPGPQPVLLARADRPAEAAAPEAPAPTPAAPAEDEPVARLAKATSDVGGRPLREPDLNAMPSPEATPEPKPPVIADPIQQAKQLIAESRRRYQNVQDYTCTFYKRERINGRETPTYVLSMKARSQPASIYFKFQRPTANAGREAIWVAGRNGGKVIVHDVGLGKLVAGTLHLDPRGSRAMEDNRHPISDAGIGHLIATVSHHWEREMKPGDSQVTIQPGVLVGGRPCTLVESGHAQRQSHFMYHLVKLYIDQETGLPIRFEAYDWPRRPGLAPELLEEYTYMNLRLNAGLSDRDFDPSNTQYSFGRF